MAQHGAGQTIKMIQWNVQNAFQRGGESMVWEVIINQEPVTLSITSSLVTGELRGRPAPSKRNRSVSVEL